MNGSSTAALHKGTRATTLGTLSVGALNYAYSLLLTRLLLPGAFAVFAAGQALLLTAGTIATCTVPWVLARRLSQAGDDRVERRAAVSFALLLNLALGTVAALACGLLALGFAGRGVAAAVALSALLVFLATTVNGWLQGDRRFGTLSRLRVLEVVVKGVVGVALVAGGAQAGGALLAFAVGAGAVLLLGLPMLRHDLRPSLASLGSSGLWRSTGGVAAVQGLVAVLVSLDVVLVAVLPVADGPAGSYQAVNVLARVPLFLAGAVAVVAFPLFARTEPGPLARGSLRTYAQVVLPLVVVLLTLPAGLLGLLFPSGYSHVTTLVRVLPVAGALLGLVHLVTTFFQATGQYRTSVRLQLVGLVAAVAGVLGGYAAGGILGLAVGSVAGPGLTAALLLRQAGRTWPGCLVRADWRLGPALLLLALLSLLREVPVLWLAVAAVVGGSAARRLLRPAAPDAPSDGRPRVLHLGFEDHRRPGSGGGALRTHEVDRRLAERYDVTVLTTSWPGAQDRVEDGVRYVHVGSARGGYLANVLSYFAVLPLAARRHPADLVVEDFAAPFSSTLAPLWAHAPVVSVVQWLQAREKSRQYRLPVFLVESLGVRLQRRYVAVSDDLADELRRRNPRAEVTVVPNGVDRDAFEVEPQAGRDVVFLGRLEVAQKGLDLLLDAVALARDALPGQVLLVGDGPDRARLEREVQRRGLGEVVRFLGRLDGADKHAVLARAGLVVMPSRFETFGIVAVEALACSTPVLAFDIPCLRAVVPPDAGRLVPAFDVPALAAALGELLSDPERAADMGRRGRAFARRFDWDDVAAAQAEVYDEVLRTGPASRSSAYSAS